MGRPVKKINFGTAAGAAKGILISARKTSTARQSYIIAQRGQHTYDVYNATDGTFRVKLIEGSGFTANAAASAVMFGFTDPGDDASRVAIKKLTARVAVAFDGTRYKWTLQNDSSADYIVLTTRI